MVILGVDPGLASVGWGAVQVAADRSLSCLGQGCITTPAGLGIEQRILTIYQQLMTIADDFHAGAVSMESLFFAKNVNSAMMVSRVCGVIALVAAQKGITFAEYTPLQIKQATSCYGRADKMQVQKMIALILKMDIKTATSHAADALAAAICHAQSSRLATIC